MQNLDKVIKTALKKPEKTTDKPELAYDPQT